MIFGHESNLTVLFFEKSKTKRIESEIFLRLKIYLIKRHL